MSSYTYNKSITYIVDLSDKLQIDFPFFSGLDYDDNSYDITIRMTEALSPADIVLLGNFIDNYVNPAFYKTLSSKVYLPCVSESSSSRVYKTVKIVMYQNSDNSVLDKVELIPFYVSTSGTYDVRIYNLTKHETVAVLDSISSSDSLVEMNTVDNVPADKDLLEIQIKTSSPSISVKVEGIIFHNYTII